MVTASLPNLDLVPVDLRPEVLMGLFPLGFKKLRDLKKLLFENTVLEPVSLGLARSSDLALFIESNIHEQLFNLCKVATLTWSTTQGAKYLLF